jgi:hypothetical protein
MLGLVEKHQIVRPVTDVVLSGNLIGSHTKAALMDSRLRPVPSYRYFVLASKTISISHHKEDPHGFEAVCRWVAVFGD